MNICTKCDFDICICDELNRMHCSATSFETLVYLRKCNQTRIDKLESALVEIRDHEHIQKPDLKSHHGFALNNNADFRYGVSQGHVCCSAIAARVCPKEVSDGN